VLGAPSWLPLSYDFGFWHLTGSQSKVVHGQAVMEYMITYPGWYTLDSILRWLFGTPPASHVKRVPPAGANDVTLLN